MKGRIIKIISNQYTVQTENVTLVCHARGRFRNDNIKPVVGDMVRIDETDQMIKEVLKRKNELTRPQVSNVDQVIIVTSVYCPDFDSNLLDKLLVMVEYNNIKPIICFTKLDKIKGSELKEIKKVMKYYKNIGYHVYKNSSLRKIRTLFKDKVTVLAGQTGAGKSELLNRLDANLNLKTGETSKALGRGRHTTRHVELMPIFNGLVADTPGFSALDLEAMTKTDIKHNFKEFYANEQNCEFKTCFHLSEHNCAIKELVKKGKIKSSRYKNYLNFISKIDKE